MALQAFQERYGVVSLEHQAQAVIKAAAELQMEIMSLELRLESYLASMGPTHPEVELLKNRIRIRKEQLDRLRRGELPKYAQSEGIPEDPDVENLFLPIESIPKLQMEYFRREMAVKIWGAMVQFLSQKLEETRLEMEKSFASVSTVSWVDRAEPPELRSKPKRRLIVMFAGMFSLAFSFFWMKQAVEGKFMSGLMVATMIASTWSGVTPASSSAARPASAPRSELAWSGRQRRRSAMPVRVRIHSSEVSTIFSRS